MTVPDTLRIEIVKAHSALTQIVVLANNGRKEEARKWLQQLREVLARLETELD